MNYMKNILKSSEVLYQFGQQPHLSVGKSNSLLLKVLGGTTLMGFSIYRHYNTECSEQKMEFYTEQELKNLLQKYPNVKVVDQKLTQIQYSQIRDQTTPTQEFRLFSDRIMRILLEAALNDQPLIKSQKETPLCPFNSSEIENEENLIAVTIMRAGNSFLHELFNIMPQIDVGQILLQRNQNSKEKEPIFYFAKMPNEMVGKRIILLDPMLASGGSVNKAVEILLKMGVQEDNITFVNLIACEVGLKSLTSKYPNVKIITGAVDPELLSGSKYIAPGLGDFGDRYYGTIQTHKVEQ